MHIAFYSPSWPALGAANGVVTYVDAMCEELRRLGHDVSVVTLHGIHAGAGTECERRPYGLLSRLRRRIDRQRQDSAFAAQRIKSLFAELHRRQPIDLIEMEEAYGWFGDVAKLGIPLVVRLHGPCFRCPEWVDPAQRNRWVRNRERRERKGLEAARAITSPARATLEDTAAFYRLSAPIQEVVLNPVRITPLDQGWSPTGSDPDLLLFIGQFSIRKGADILVRAFDLVADEWPSLELDMVGPDHGIAVDGETLHFEAYCARFVRPEIRARIRMRGLLKPAEIAPLRLRAGLTLVASRSEVFPYIVSEAMAVGSPVVSTRWGGEEEMITHGVSGWIAAENTPEALADVLREALSASPEARAACGRSGWAFCEANLSQRAIVEKMLPLYEAVIAERSGER